MARWTLFLQNLKSLEFFPCCWNADWRLEIHSFIVLVIHGFFIHFSSRLREHGTVYAMILLYSFQFSSWLREYGTVYAMILLYSFQFSSWLREYGTVYAMILLYCIYDVSMSLETKPKKSPCIKISSSVELK